MFQQLFLYFKWDASKRKNWSNVDLNESSEGMVAGYVYHHAVSEINWSWYESPDFEFKFKLKNFFETHVTCELLLMVMNVVVCFPATSFPGNKLINIFWFEGIHGCAAFYGNNRQSSTMLLSSERISINILAVFRNGIAFDCKKDFPLKCLLEDKWRICKRLTLSKVRLNWRKIHAVNLTFWFLTQKIEK